MIYTTLLKTTEAAAGTGFVAGRPKMSSKVAVDLFSGQWTWTAQNYKALTIANYSPHE